AFQQRQETRYCVAGRSPELRYNRALILKEIIESILRLQEIEDITSVAPNSTTFEEIAVSKDEIGSPPL
ncbi:MAG: hypothetical protein WB781_21845, partial [Candidatus Sulfotelmatobacter sp.]